MNTRAIPSVRLRFSSFILHTSAFILAAQSMGCREGSPDLRPGYGSGPDVSRTPQATVPPIRVLLRDGPVRSAKVAVHGPCQWRPAGADQVLAEDDRLAPVVLRASPDGIASGARTWPMDRLELVPERDGSLFVDDHSYRGHVRLLKQADGTLLVVNVVDLEAYVASVTSGEMPPSFPQAARRAQAVAARTYAMFQMKTRTAEAAFDVYDTVRDQHYPGRSWETTDSLEAAAFTRGIVATYDGCVFCAYYSACCGGATANASHVPTFRKNAVPALAGVPCSWCRLPENERFAWLVELQREELSDKLRGYFASRGVTIREVEDLAVASRFADGRADRLRVTHSGGSLRLAARDFRSAVGGYARIRSTRFDVQRREDGFLVSGTGWGHGVGMCQWGARGLAENGRDCVEIVKYYYPGCGLAMVY